VAWCAALCAARRCVRRGGRLPGGPVLALRCCVARRAHCLASCWWHCLRVAGGPLWVPGGRVRGWWFRCPAPTDRVGAGLSVRLSPLWGGAANGSGGWFLLVAGAGFEPAASAL